MLHPAWHFTWYSAYKLNKQGDNIQPWYTPFLIWNQSVVPCPVLTIVSWTAYIFLRRRVRWSGIPISWRVFHSLLWSTIALISHASKVMLNILQARLQQYVNRMFKLMFKLFFEKAEEPEIKLPTFSGSSKKQESSRKTSISALLTMPKPLTVWITINCGKFWKRWEYQTT